MASRPWTGSSGPLQYSAFSPKNRLRLSVPASPVGYAAVNAAIKSRTTSSALGGPATTLIVAPLSLWRRIGASPPAPKVPECDTLPAKWGSADPLDIGTSSAGSGIADTRVAQPGSGPTSAAPQSDGITSLRCFETSHR